MTKFLRASRGVTTQAAPIPPVLPAPVSRWHLDGNGDVEGSGSAIVLNGTPETGEAPLLAVGGSSIFFDGADDFGQASHNAVYATSAATIVAYSQPDTMPSAGTNRCIIGKGAEITHEFQIEQYNDGGTSKLRAYWYDGTSVRWVNNAPTGVVQIAPNNGFCVALSLGTNGVLLYHRPAGGSWSLVGQAAFPAVLTSNTADWFFGRSPYGGAFYDGGLDRVDFYDAQLGIDQLALLPAPVTVERGADPGLLQVPRLDLWLTNDDMGLPGTGTVRYAKPSGSGVGGTTEGSAGALQATLTASAAGDTVVCLQGYYSAPNGLTFPAGSSASNPVTVMAKPGSWAVVCQDVSFLNMGLLDHAEGEGAAKTWTLHDAATNTWRISYGGAATTLNGCFFQGGMAHMLFPYPSLTALMSNRDSDGSAPQTKNQYWFSGTAVSGGFAYIRLDRPNWRDMVNGSTGAPDSTYGAWPDDGRYTVGVEGGGAQAWFSRSSAGDFKTGRPIIGQGLNPNDLRIYIAGHNDVALLNNSSGSFTRLGSGMNSLGYRYYVTGRSNHEMHRGSHYIRGYYVATLNANVSNITAHRARIFGCGEWRLQGSMAVMKYGEFLNPPDQMLEGSHRNAFLTVPFNANFSATNLTFDNCTICYYHEVVEGDEPINKIRFVNCTFHMTYDEFSQNANEKISQMEVGYCYMRDSAIFNGGSGGGTGTQSPLSTEWYHHNIVDQRCPRGAFSNRKVTGGVNSLGRDVSSQGCTKKYNNTIIFNTDCATGRTPGYGWCGNDEMVTAPSSAATYDEFFNNIVIRHETKRYNGTEGATPGPNDAAENGMLITNGSIYNKCYRDYNLYYRNVPVDPATGAFTEKKYHAVSRRYFTGHNFDYVRTNTGLEPGSTVFFGSADYNLTVSGIGKAWEANASDANPQIPSVSSFPASRMDYRPQNLAAVSASATPPSAANWWSSPGWTSYGAQSVPFNMAPSAWKGALDPNGSTMPVGVQSP